MRRLGLFMLATLLALGMFIGSAHWRANAATQLEAFWPPADLRAPGPYSAASVSGERPWAQRSRGPAIEPYVRPDFAREMRTLRPTILAAARRHNRPELSGMSDHDFAVLIALLMYNEHYGWFEERVTPVQILTPFYEDLQRETNEAGIANLSVWPANIRPSVALEILRQQMPLPASTSVMTVPVAVAGSQIDIGAFKSQGALYAAITKEISQPALAVEYLAANLDRGQYRAHVEHVAVTWRTLAAWHNQGIVSPRDIRANAVASDYIHRSSAYLATARELIDTPPLWQRPVQ